MLQDVLDVEPKKNILVRKVKAHQTFSDLHSNFDLWLYYGNETADKAAKLANLDRPTHI